MASTVRKFEGATLVAGREAADPLDTDLAVADIIKTGRTTKFGAARAIEGPKPRSQLAVQRKVYCWGARCP